LLRVIRKRESKQRCAGEEGEEWIFHDEKV
jgi:hypothetical protein